MTKKLNYSVSNSQEKEFIPKFEASPGLEKESAVLTETYNPAKAPEWADHYITESTDPVRDAPPRHEIFFGNRKFIVELETPNKYGFWVIRTAGDLPASLAGHYTSSERAISAVKQYMNSKSVS